MVTPASISIATSNVTYPGAGPSLCERIFRLTPGVAAGGVVCADASVAANSVIAQSAQDAIPAKSRRVSMIDLPCDVRIHRIRTCSMVPAFPTPVCAQNLPQRDVLGNREAPGKDQAC